MTLEQLEKLKGNQEPKKPILVLPNDEEDEILNIYGFPKDSPALEAFKKIQEGDAKTEKEDEEEEEYETDTDEDLWEALNLLQTAMEDLEKIMEYNDASASPFLYVSMKRDLWHTIAACKKFLDQWENT